MASFKHMQKQSECYNKPPGTYPSPSLMTNLIVSLCRLFYLPSTHCPLPGPPLNPSEANSIHAKLLKVYFLLELAFFLKRNQGRGEEFQIYDLVPTTLGIIVQMISHGSNRARKNDSPGRGPQASMGFPFPGALRQGGGHG